MKRIVLIVAVVLVVLGLYLLLWPVPIDPVAWQPAPDPGLVGPFEPNNALAAVEYLTEVGLGPEDMTKGPDGLIYTGLGDGRVVRFDPESRAPAETFVDTGGRPLGMEFDEQGTLFVSDAFRGLLAIDPDGAITVLTDSVNGEPMMFVNDLSLSPGGEIWFTDSSRRFDQSDFMLDFIEGQTTGRLLRYDLESGETEVHVEGLGFANGVAVGGRGSYVWVAETLSARIIELTTVGPDAGMTRTLVGGLPGHPDNLSFNDDMTTIWVALPAPRMKQLEALAPRPFFRKVLMRIPGATSFPIEPYSWVVGLNHDGEVIHNLQDPLGHYPTVTSVKEIDGYLYLGSIYTNAVGRIPVPVRE